MKKLNNIPQQGFIYNVINKIINTINELIEQINEGAVPQWLLDLINAKADKTELEAKADKNGIYEDLTAGNLVGRNTDATVSTDSFIFRTTGGSANLSDAGGKLLKVEGNVQTVVDNQSTYVLTPFTGKVFKSYGFNHFNPIESNILKGYNIDDVTNQIVEGAANDSIILVRCVACSASAEAGYEITVDENINISTHKVVYSKFKPIIGQTFASSDILTIGTHRNSTSFLPTQNGWLAIYLINNNLDELDYSKICVHICWSGYNDGKYEAFAKGADIEVPYQLVHEWGLGSTENVRDILDYEHKKWYKKVDRIKLQLNKTNINKTIITKDGTDLTPDLYELVSVSNVTYSEGQIGGSLTINVTNVNDVQTQHSFIFVERVGNIDYWKWEEYIYDEDPEVEPTIINHIVTTDSTTYYDNVPTMGVWILESQTISDIKIRGEFIGCDELVTPFLMYFDDINTPYITNDKKFKWELGYINSAADKGESQVNAIINALQSEYIYYELETIESGDFDVNNITESWDFGVEFFDNYDDGEIYEVEGVSVVTSYTGFLLDDIRALKNRVLQDRIKNVYVIETSTIPSGTHNFVPPMIAENTLWHYHHEAVGETTVDTYYQYNNGSYQVVPYKIRPNYYHIWQGNLTSSLVLQLEAIAGEEIGYYNEYMIEFTTGTTAPTVTFPSGVKWNSAPSIEVSHTYQVSIVNGIGCIIADNESAS